MVDIKNGLLKKYMIITGAVWGLWIVAMVLAYLMVISPQNQKLDAVQKDFSTSNELYNMAQIAQREDTKKHMAEKLEEVTAIAHKFVTNPEESSQLTFKISQLAAQCRLGNFATKTRELAGTLDAQAGCKVAEGWVELTFTATFNQFAAFLNSLERNQPAVFVESAAIKRSDSGSEHDARVLISYLSDKPDGKPVASAQ